MDSFDLESTLKTLAEAKVQLAIRRENNLTQDQSVKGLRQENKQLAALIDQMAGENQSLAERIGHLTAARSLSKQHSLPDGEVHSDESQGGDERWTALIHDWRPDQGKKMCRKGVPGGVRCAVWKLAVGNDLRLTHQLYYILMNRAKASAPVAGEDGWNSQALRDVARVLVVMAM